MMSNERTLFVGMSLLMYRRDGSSNNNLFNIVRTIDQPSSHDSVRSRTREDLQTGRDQISREHCLVTPCGANMCSESRHFGGSTETGHVSTTIAIHSSTTLPRHLRIFRSSASRHKQPLQLGCSFATTYRADRQCLA